MTRIGAVPSRATRRGGASAVRRRVLCASACVALGVANAACYAYVPAPSGAAHPGERIGIVVTDQGRVALGEQLGPGVDRIEGTLVDARDEQYVLRVATVQNIQGERSHWSGESVRVPLSAIAQVESRRLSGRKTTLAVGVTVASLGLAVLASSLAGFGFEGGPNGPPPPGNGQ